MNFLSERPLQHDRANGRMGLVHASPLHASLQLLYLLTGLDRLVFAVSSILSQKRRFQIKKLVKSYLLIMSSSDASLALTQAQIPRPQKRRQSMTQKSRSCQTRVNIKTPQMMMNRKMSMLMSLQQTKIGQLNTRQKENKKKNKNSKRNYALDMPFSLFGLLLHPKTTHLSGISFLSTEAKIEKHFGGLQAL